MSEAIELWKQALPPIREKVTGVGVWAALNNAVPLVIENDTLILGLAAKDNDLAGHLRMTSTKRFMEMEVSRRLGKQTAVRVIEGVTLQDWDRAKRRDAEARRLQELSEQRTRAEITSKTSWEGTYEQLSRRFAAVQNKTLPQNRARFLVDAIALVAEALKAQPIADEINERNFGRCIERISQYSDVPSTLVAVMVLEKAEAI